MTARRYLATLFLAATLTGCAVRAGVGYRVYDPYYSDYHPWDQHEIILYNQWSAENHRDAHRDFRKLNRGEQKEYWTWRHTHGDRH